MAAPRASWSLTSHLLETHQPLYKSATQHPFLLAGAEGRLDKETLSRWLANDRLYIHSYIRAAGKLLASLDLPRQASGSQGAPETQLADWLIEALAAVRREERFFLNVAGRYGLRIELGIPLVSTRDTSSREGPGRGSEGEEEVLGLGMMRSVFEAISTVPTTSPPDPDAAGQPGTGPAAATANPPPPLPWLEGALTFWGTERCYLDAWSWARDKARECSAPSGGDADGGALRNEFIPNWSSREFARFVDRLGGLIDAAVVQVLEGYEEGEERERAKGDILGRVEGRWRTLLVAERAFWPEV